MPLSTEHEDYRLLVEMLKQARVGAKAAQTDLAESLGITQTFISKVERGERRLDVVELVEILEGLGVSPEIWMKTYLERRQIAHKGRRVSRKISS